MNLAPGVWIHPQVRLVRPLGKGGMASVWVGAHMRLHTQVAVKVLSPALAKDPTHVARFQREGRLWSLIQSPHVVQTYDQGVYEESTPFMVMEWLDGETLKERLEREGRLSLHDTLVVVRQLARALESAHQVGVVHRDVKASNLFLLRSDGEPLLKLLDWGVAKRLPDASFDDELDVETFDDDSLGTPSYMSPEQLRRASAVDRRADVWAMAVVTYRCLVGAMPFDADDYPTLCFSIVQGSYRPATEVDPRWAPVERWFARSFDLEIEQRYGGAAEAAAALEPLVAELQGHQPAGAVDDDDDEETIPRRPS